ncbi:hypothetical protein KNSL1_007346 [Colletotrichum chrysophilum]|nr:hypothetical protein KNSL1_007346 [Colletotrichum chrysophilum]
MASPADAVGSWPQFRTYHAIHKKGGKVTTETLTDPFGLPPHAQETSKDSSYALVINRKFDKDNSEQPKSVTLKVNSPHLLQAFHDVVGPKYPTVASDFKSPFELQSPFQMLVHYWNELETYREETDSPDMRVHLGMLLQFMEHELGEDRKALLDMLKTKQVTFLTAWVLFRPGNLLYTKVLDHPWILMCHKTAYEQNSSAGPYLEVHCTYTDYNGAIVGETARKITIFQKQQFGGDSPAFITDLPIYPRKYVDAESLDARLEDRGRRFLQHKEVSVEAYDGIAQYLKEPPYSYYSVDMDRYPDLWLPYTESGRVVVDRKTFHHDHYNSSVSVKKVDHPDPLTCPPFVFGFALSRKVWCHLFLDHLSPINAMMFERELQRLMQYATIWKAVLLLDEADIFLEKREDNPANANRNALVAVFLKQLEYFSGVIFLTTNRLRTFDAAMSSRIHLALGYKAPDAETRRLMWLQCLHKVPTDEIEFNDMDDASENFVSHRINGREISNAVNTARTIARFEGKKLQVRHINQVLVLRSSFQRALQAEGTKLTVQSGSTNALKRTGSIVDEPDEYTS